jgi:hypothetical protein
LLQQIERDVSQHRKILRAVVLADAALVFTYRKIILNQITQPETVPGDLTLGPRSAWFVVGAMGLCGSALAPTVRHLPGVSKARPGV